MLGRKDYTKDELANGRAGVEDALGAYRALADAVAATGDREAAAALAAFEPVLTRNLVLALDRCYVHRIRNVAGKDGNPLNEVELVVESFLGHGGELTVGSVLKYSAEQAVLGLEPGSSISLSMAQFATLAEAFLDTLQERFVTA